MSNSIAANDIIQNIDDLLAEYPVDECISILQEVVKQFPFTGEISTVSPVTFNKVAFICLPFCG